MNDSMWGLIGVISVAAVVLLRYWIFPHLKRMWDKRPTNRLYTCERNGVVAVVRARDYDKAARRFWRSVRQGITSKPRGSTGLRFTKVAPFATYTVKGSGVYVGTLEQLQELLQDCYVETREFYVPDQENLLEHEDQREGMIAHEQFRQLIDHSI